MDGSALLCVACAKQGEEGGGYGVGFQLRSTLFIFFWVLDLAQDLCAVNLKQATTNTDRYNGPSLMTSSNW